MHTQWNSAAFCQERDHVEEFIDDFTDSVTSEGAVQALATVAKQLEVTTSSAKDVKQLLVEFFLLKACVNSENASTIASMNNADQKQASELTSTALKVIRQQKAFIASNKLGLSEDDLHPTLLQLAQNILESGGKEA